MTKPQGINAPYKYTFPIEKAFIGEDGRMRLVGAATGPEVDLESQRVAPALIEKWVGSINAGLMELVYDDNHKTDSVVSELGTIEKAWTNDSGHMMVQVLLDEDNPLSQYIHKSARKGKQYGMSIFGKASDWKDEIVNGQMVRTITDGIITKIAHTTRPVWTPSFGTVLSKAIDAAKTESALGDNAMAEATVTPQTSETVVKTSETTEVATTDSGAATSPDSGNTPAESTPSGDVATDNGSAPVEKSISADNKRDAQKMAKFAKLLGELNVLGAEIGLSGASDTTEASDGPKTVEKSQAEADDTDEKYTRLEKSLADQSELIEKLLDRVTDGSAPGVLRKSEPVDPLAELTAVEDPRERMRLAFAAAQGK